MPVARITSYGILWTTSCWEVSSLAPGVVKLLQPVGDTVEALQVLLPAAKYQATKEDTRKRSRIKMNGVHSTKKHNDNNKR